MGSRVFLPIRIQDATRGIYNLLVMFEEDFEQGKMKTSLRWGIYVGLVGIGLGKGWKGFALIIPLGSEVRVGSRRLFWKLFFLFESFTILTTCFFWNLKEQRTKHHFYFDFIYLFLEQETSSKYAFRLASFGFNHEKIPHYYLSTALLYYLILQLRR